MLENSKHCIFLIYLKIFLSSHSKAEEVANEVTKKCQKMHEFKALHFVFKHMIMSDSKDLYIDWDFAKLINIS